MSFRVKRNRIVSSSEDESDNEQDVSSNVTNSSSIAPAEQSTGGSSSANSSSSFHSLHELTTNLNKLDLQNASSVSDKTAIIEDDLNAFLSGDEDDELNPKYEVVPAKAPRKSIIILSSGEESEAEEISHQEAETKKAPITPPKPLLDQKPKLQDRYRDLSPELVDVKPKVFPYFNVGERVEPKIKPKATLAISKAADELEKSPKKKTIKKILNYNQLDKETRIAERAEKSRRARILARQRLFKKTFPEEDIETSAILDFDAESKKVLVKISKKLLPLMKPHQLDGVRFMYDCVIENVKVLEEDELGSGCILAHSMGLGKTFQIVVFLHTTLTNRYIQDQIERVLIIVPYNVIENWAQEFDKWFDKCNLSWMVNIFEMRNAKTVPRRVELMKTWFKRGGIMLITNTLFSRTISSMAKADKRVKDTIHKCFLEPGPDLVIIDEGHLLKNDESAFNQALTLIQTNRRIVLTGTPLQNNLTEYFVMVDFCKPLLLGTKKEFRNRFQNPIEKGQHHDSDRYEVMVMKRRIHILFEMLKGCIHRCDYNILVPYLQPKKEYVLCLKMTEPQINMYRHYLKYFAEKPTGENKSPKSFLRDKQLLSLVWTHPALVHDYYLESQDKTNFASQIGTWYEEFVDMETIYNIEHGAKFTFLFAILEMCELTGDKLVIFSQSLLNLNLIERMLRQKMKSYGRENGLDGMRYEEIRDKTGGVSHRWIPETDYFRIDGSVDSSERSNVIAQFNDAEDTRARLMLVSTRAGGIGTNLVGANRAIIFDASFNPSHDLQAIFRIYRLGQTKPVFIYRFTAYGTMEDKIYKRQIVKQSLSCRVLDEQQILRHYKKNDLSEMYRLDTEYDDERVLPMCDDNILNDLLFDYGPLIVSWHEHDTLLENKPEEDLTEEDRKAAWLEYEKARNVPVSGAAAANEAFNKYNKAPVASGAAQLLNPEIIDL